MRDMGGTNAPPGVGRPVYAGDSRRAGHSGHDLQSVGLIPALINESTGVARSAGPPFPSPRRLRSADPVKLADEPVTHASTARSPCQACFDCRFQRPSSTPCHHSSDPNSAASGSKPSPSLRLHKGERRGGAPARKPHERTALRAIRTTPHSRPAIMQGGGQCPGDLAPGCLGTSVARYPLVRRSRSVPFGIDNRHSSHSASQPVSVPLICCGTMRRQRRISVVSRRAGLLTAGQRESLQRDGYLLVPSLLDEIVLAPMRARLDELVYQILVAWEADPGQDVEERGVVHATLGPSDPPFHAVPRASTAGASRRRGAWPRLAPGRAGAARTAAWLRPPGSASRLLPGPADPRAVAELVGHVVHQRIHLR